MRFDRALLYVGPPKTGSTSIQAFVWKNRDSLMAQGVYVPLAGRRKAQHVGLAAVAARNAGGKHRKVADRQAKRQEQLESAFLVDLECELADAPPSHTLLFMGESMFASDASGIRAFRAVLAAYATRLESLMYLRRQDLWLASRTLQKRKDGRRQEMELNLGSPKQFSDIVQSWYTESDRCIIRRLDSTFLRNGSLIQDFCESSGIDTSDLDLTEIRKNAALTQEQLEIADAFNDLTLAISWKDRSKYRTKLLNECTALFGGTKIEFPAAESKAIFESFQKINQWLHATVDPGGPPLFFNTDFGQQQTVPANANRYTRKQLRAFLDRVAPGAPPKYERHKLIEQILMAYLDDVEAKAHRRA